MTAVSVLDDKTASAIREALTAASVGRVEEACAIGERALAEGGDPGALNTLLGSVLCGAGKLREGVERLRIASDHRPQDRRVLTNLATALCELEDYPSALSVVTEAVAREDESLRLARLRGFAAQMSNELPTAIAAYSFVLETEPNDWETWNNLGNCHSAAGDFDSAVGALKRATDLNPQAAPTRLNYCRALQDTGNLTEAEAQLRRMAEDFPADAKPLFDLHALLRFQGRDDEQAENVLRQAIEREPDDVELRLALGRFLAACFEMDKAEEEFRAILERDSSNEDAFVSIALIGEQYRPALLEDLVDDVASSGADSACLNFVKAVRDRRAKRYREGLQALQGVPPDYHGIHRAHIEGQLFDALGDYDAAFAAFTRMNDLQIADESRPLERAERLRIGLRQSIDLTTEQWLESWNAPAIEPDRQSPVFLVGFPRSGTTLLDTMLMGHPDLEVMEERPMLTRIELEIGGYEALAAMSPDQVKQAQERYFSIAREYTDLRDGARLIDKTPLSLNRVALIHRLFPNPTFVLALRHPADVLLSCFTSNFRLNSSMANFLRLDTAAEFYDLSFRAWENARELIPAKIHAVRYERMIEAPEAEIRPIIEALGLDWRPEMLDHQKTAGNRGVISTASYAQVTEPLYNRSAGRWLNYRRHLEPVLPVLKPWIERFGYETR